MSATGIYIAMLIAVLTFFGIMVVIGRHLSKKLNEELIKKRETKTNSAKSSVDEYVKMSEFQEFKVDFKRLIEEINTNNQINTLVAKDLGQVKSQVSNFKNQFEHDHETLMGISGVIVQAARAYRGVRNFPTHSTYNTHGYTVHTNIPQIEEYEYVNAVLGKSGESIKSRVRGKMNPPLGKHLKSVSSQ